MNDSKNAKVKKEFVYFVLFANFACFAGKKSN